MNFSKILKSFCSLSVLTMLSRISGFVKVAAIAAFYGRSVEADMLTAVIVLPDLVYKFLSEGLISGSAVPIFVQAKEDKKVLTNAFWSLFWVTFIAGTIVSLILFLGTSEICSILMPGIDSNLKSLLHMMWIILIPYLTLGLLSGLQTSLLNAKLNFAKPAIGAILVNVSIIIGTFIGAGNRVEVIAVANTFGALIQLIWLFYLIIKEKIIDYKIKDCFCFDYKIVTGFIRSSAPIVAWISILPFIPVYERRLLSVDQGSIATLNYTEKLFNLPLGVISISLAHVILPNLSSLSGKARTKFLIKSLGLAALGIIPVIAFIWFCSDFIVKTVFMRGKFSLDDVAIASNLFKIYAIALLPASFNLILNRGFFAAKNFRTPFIAGLISALLQLYLCNVAVSMYKIQGIAIAAISSWSIQFIILVIAQIIINKKEKA